MNGQEFSELRKKKGFLMKEVAQEAHIHITDFSKFESGSKRFGHKRMKRLDAAMRRLLKRGPKAPPTLSADVLNELMA